MIYESRKTKASHNKYKELSPMTASVTWNSDRIELRVFGELPCKYIEIANSRTCL